MCMRGENVILVMGYATNISELYSKYKIFLGKFLDDTFLNIADSSGHGHDHCEFVGGSSIYSRTSLDWESPFKTGGWSFIFKLVPDNSSISP